MRVLADWNSARGWEAGGGLGRWTGAEAGVVGMEALELVTRWSASSRMLRTWVGSQMRRCLAMLGSAGPTMSISSSSSRLLAGTTALEVGCRNIWDTLRWVESLSVHKSNMQSGLRTAPCGESWLAPQRDEMATIRSSSTCDRRRSHEVRSSPRTVELVPSTRKLGSNSAYTNSALVAPSASLDEVQTCTSTHVSKDGTNCASVCIEGRDRSAADAAERLRRNVRSPPPSPLVTALGCSDAADMTWVRSLVPVLCGAVKMLMLAMVVVVQSAESDARGMCAHTRWGQREVGVCNPCATVATSTARPCDNVALRLTTMHGWATSQVQAARALRH